MNWKQRGLVRAGLVAAGAVVAGGLVWALATFPPADDTFYPKCMSYRLTGLHCPGCGLTRAAHALLNGRVGQAVAYNPLIVGLSPVILFATLRWQWYRLWGTEPRRLMQPWVVWPLFAVIVVYWVLRNVPVYPFTLLAPHELGS